jgi:hypothetical protein
MERSAQTMFRADNTVGGPRRTMAEVQQTGQSPDLAKGSSEWEVVGGTEE